MTSDELRHIAKALLTYADEMDGHVLDFSDIHQAILATGVHVTFFQLLHILKEE